MKQTETSLANKHDHHVHGEIFFYSTLSLDQNLTSKHDQQNPLHVYKATNDKDTLYLHQAMKTKDCPQFRIAM